MKPEPSEIKKEPSIKTGFNFTSQRFSNESLLRFVEKVVEKDFNVRNRKKETKVIIFLTKY